MNTTDKFQPSKQRLVLIAYFTDALPSDLYFAYNRIEADTGIKMDNKGKGLLRNVLTKNLKRHFRTSRAQGIELDSPANAEQIVAGSTNRVASSVKRAYKTTNSMVTTHGENLGREAFGRLSFVQQCLAGVLAGADGLKKMYARNRKALPSNVSDTTIPRL